MIKKVEMCVYNLTYAFSNYRRRREMEDTAEKKGKPHLTNNTREDHKMSAYLKYILEFCTKILLSNTRYLFVLNEKGINAT